MAAAVKIIRQDHTAAALRDRASKADQDYLDRFADDVAALKAQADVVIASCHWDLQGEVFAYMKQIAHTAIDAGADIVMGHGPHSPLPVGHYKGKPIFYGLGSFSFHTGHLGIKHGDWIGIVARLESLASGKARTTFSLVRHNDANETVAARLEDEAKVFNALQAASLGQGAALRQKNGVMVVTATEPAKVSCYGHRSRSDLFSSRLYPRRHQQDDLFPRR